MKKTCVGLALFIQAIFAAKPALAEFAAGTAAEVGHAKGDYALTGRYDFREYYIGVYGALIDGSKGANNIAAADITVPFRIFDFSAGGAYLGNVTRYNGTHYNFSLRIAANVSDAWRVELIHISNGKKIFGWHEDKSNLGWNLLGLAYRF